MAERLVIDAEVMLHQLLVSAGSKVGLVSDSRLFTARAGETYLYISEAMTGSVMTADGRKSLGQLVAEDDKELARGQLHRVRLGSDARGRIELADDVAVVFHFVQPPVAPAKQPLPEQWHASAFRDIDWFTTIAAAFSFLFHFLVVTVVYSDWMDDVVDGDMAVTQLVEQVRSLPPPPALEKPRIDAASEASAFATATAKAPANAPSSTGSRAGAGPGKTTAATGAGAGQSRAAEIATQLAALELETLTGLGAAGPSTQAVLGDGSVPVALLDEQGRSERGAQAGDPGGLGIGEGPGADSVKPGEGNKPLSELGVTAPSKDGAATEVGTVKKVAGPRGNAIVAPPSLAAGRVDNAGSVVAGMRGRFRRCYQQGLDINPELAGMVTLVARIGANGEVQNVGGGGGGLGIIVPCLRSVVSSGAFSAPVGGSAIVSIPIQFALR